MTFSTQLRALLPDAHFLKRFVCLLAHYKTKVTELENPNSRGIDRKRYKKLQVLFQQRNFYDDYIWKKKESRHFLSHPPDHLKYWSLPFQCTIAVVGSALPMAHNDYGKMKKEEEIERRSWRWKQVTVGKSAINQTADWAVQWLKITTWNWPRTVHTDNLRSCQKTAFVVSVVILMLIEVNDDAMVIIMQSSSNNAAVLFVCACSHWLFPVWT